MIVEFEATGESGPVTIDTEQTYTINAEGVAGWILAALLIMTTEKNGLPLAMIEEETTQEEDTCTTKPPYRE
jgi:hypothetical protein